MLVGTLRVEVYIPGATSLKDKRQVVKGMIQKVQHRFNVSIASWTERICGRGPPSESPWWAQAASMWSGSCSWF